MSDELSLMLKECEERPWGSTRNSRVSILIRHHLDLLKELDRIHQAVRDYDHEELRKAIEKRK